MTSTVASLREVLQHGWDEDPDAARRAARPQLVPPARVAATVAVALLDVEAGYRPITQLERLLPAALGTSVATTLGLRRSGHLLPAGRVLRVVCQEHVPGRVEAAVVLRRGDRVVAVALQLDAGYGHWLVTELAW